MPKPSPRLIAAAYAGQATEVITSMWTQGRGIEHDRNRGVVERQVEKAIARALRAYRRQLKVATEEEDSNGT